MTVPEPLGEQRDLGQRNGPRHADEFWIRRVVSQEPGDVDALALPCVLRVVERLATAATARVGGVVVGVGGLHQPQPSYGSLPRAFAVSEVLRPCRRRFAIVLRWIADEAASALTRSRPVGISSTLRGRRMAPVEPWCA